MSYLKVSNLLPDLQSAYRPHHSTETDVLKVLADILLSLDSGNLVILTLLRLSAAFDSVDHNTFLCRLRKSYGLRGVCFDWFKSYLSCRTQQMRSTTTSSEPSEVQYGVSQGSVLGSILGLTCYRWSEAMRMRMQTICKYTVNAALLMLFACRTACMHVWMMWHAG